MSIERSYTKMVRNIEAIVDRRLKFYMESNYVGHVVSVRPLSIHVNGMDLPDDAFRVAKSISIYNLNVHDQVLVTSTKNDMPVVTAVIRSEDDIYDSLRVNGDVVVTGESAWAKCVYANAGIRLKTVNGQPTDDDIEDGMPVGTLILDIAGPTLYVLTSDNTDKENPVYSWVSIQTGP